MKRILVIPAVAALCVMNALVGASVLAYTDDERLAMMRQAAAGGAFLAACILFVSALLDPCVGSCMASVVPSFFGQAYGYVMFTGHTAPSSSFSVAAVGTCMLFGTFLLGVVVRDAFSA